MKFDLVQPSMDEVDDASGELLALPVFADRAPPHGLPGHVDWRLRGRISKLLAAAEHQPPETPPVEGLVSLGRFFAHQGENLLLPGSGRLSFNWVLFYGLGPRNGYNIERYRSSVAALVKTLWGLKVRNVGVVLPDWRQASVTARASVEILLRDLWSRKTGLKEPLDRLLVVENLEAHADLRDSARTFLSRL